MTATCLALGWMLCCQVPPEPNALPSNSFPAFEETAPAAEPAGHEPPLRIEIPAEPPVSPPRTFEQTSPAPPRRQPAQQAGAPHNDDFTAPAGSETEPQHAAEPVPQVKADALLLELFQGPLPQEISGRQMSLEEVLSQTAPGRTRVTAVVAYWKLVARLAEVFQRQDELRQLANLHPRQAAALQAAADDLHAAVLAVQVAQLELARDMALSPGAPLPLPLNVPHAGVYRTRFEEVFRRRTPHPQAHLFHRTIPLRYQALGKRAEAVQAAQDDLEAVEELLGEDPRWGEQAVAARLELGRQQRAVLDALYLYNRAIAEYALPIAGNSHAVSTLVAMLIKPGPTLPRFEVASHPQPFGSQRLPLPQPTASLEEAEQTGRRIVRKMPPSPVLHKKFGEPTLAPPQEETQDPAKPAPATASEPTPAPPEPGGESSIFAPGTSGAAPAPSSTTPSGEPGSRQAEWAPRSNRVQERPLVPVNQPDAAVEPAQFEQEVPQQPVRGTAFTRSQPPPQEFGGQAAGDYAGLGGLAPGRQVAELVSLFHWDRDEQKGDAVTLAEALASAAPPSRPAVVRTYWQAREYAAQLQVLTEVANRWSTLQPALLEQRNTAAGPRDMLAWRVQWLSAQADAVECQANLLAARFYLTHLLGKPLAGAWAVPVTVPHAGGYQTRLAEAEATLPADQLQHLGTLDGRIQGTQQRLKELARQVIASESQRAGLWQAFPRGQVGLGELIHHSRQQLEATVQFLAELTDYNRTIADYVFAVAPPTTSAQQMVQALVFAAGEQEP